MPNTTPDNIAYPDTSWTAGVIAAIAAMATSIQTAFSKRQRYSYRWADATARTAQTGMSAGDTGFQADTKIEYTYLDGAWTISGGVTPLFIVNRGSAQSITGGAYALVSAAYATPAINTGFTSFSAGALTIANSGWYRVSAYLRWSSVQTALAFQITVNSTSIDTSATVVSDVRLGSSFFTNGNSAMVFLTTTDVVRLYAFTTSTQNLGVNPRDISFAVEWVHA